MSFTSYKLTDQAVESLKELILPVYPDPPSTFHATHKFGAKAGTPIPDADEIKVIGVADDGKGIQALVVTVDDRTHNDNGKHYHITWSLDRSATAEARIDGHPNPEKRKERPYKPAHSNGVMREYGFEPLEDPIIITDFIAGHEEENPQGPKTDFKDSSEPNGDSKDGLEETADQDSPQSAVAGTSKARSEITTRP